MRDKLAHFLVGAIIAAALLTLSMPAWVAVAAVLAAAIAKELLDAKGFGTPEAEDVVATLLGGLLAAAAHDAAPWAVGVAVKTLAAFYVLWVLFIAIMGLKRIRDAGLLSPQARALGAPLLIVGYPLDFVLNVIPMTLILVELPRETTISARLKRHNRNPVDATSRLSRWRKDVAVWFEPLLDPFDPSGDHI